MFGSSRQLDRTDPSHQFRELVYSYIGFGHFFDSKSAIVRYFHLACARLGIGRAPDDIHNVPDSAFADMGDYLARKERLDFAKNDGDTQQIIANMTSLSLLKLILLVSLALIMTHQTMRRADRFYCGIALAIIEFFDHLFNHCTMLRNDVLLLHSYQHNARRLRVRAGDFPAITLFARQHPDFNVLDTRLFSKELAAFCSAIERDYVLNHLFHQGQRAQVNMFTYLGVLCTLLLLGISVFFTAMLFPSTAKEMSSTYYLGWSIAKLLVQCLLTNRSYYEKKLPPNPVLIEQSQWADSVAALASDYQQISRSGKWTGGKLRFSAEHSAFNQPSVERDDISSSPSSTGSGDTDTGEARALLPQSPTSMAEQPSVATGSEAVKGEEDDEDVEIPEQFLPFSRASVLHYRVRPPVLGAWLGERVQAKQNTDYSSCLSLLFEQPPSCRRDAYIAQLAEIEVHMDDELHLPKPRKTASQKALRVLQFLSDDENKEDPRESALQTQQPRGGREKVAGSGKIEQYYQQQLT